MHFTNIREYGLPPLDEEGSRDLLETWIEQCRGTAKITGKKAVNPNPIVTADGGGGRQVDLAWWWIHVGGAPANWYVEKGRRFARPDGEAFGIASITTTAHRGGVELLTYALVTRDAVEQAATVHPLVLPADLHDDWLGPELAGDGGLLAEALSASEELSRSTVIVGDDDS